jgi:hypothetical protein
LHERRAPSASGVHNTDALQRRIDSLEVDADAAVRAAKQREADHQRELAALRLRLDASTPPRSERAAAVVSNPVTASSPINGPVAAQHIDATADTATTWRLKKSGQNVVPGASSAPPSPLSTGPGSAQTLSLPPSSHVPARSRSPFSQADHANHFRDADNEDSVTAIDSVGIRPELQHSVRSESVSHIAQSPLPSELPPRRKGLTSPAAAAAST